MISNYSKSYVRFTRSSFIFFTRYFFNLIDVRHKNIRIIIRFFILYHTNQTLKTHTRVYMLRGQRFKASIFFTIVLDEYIVPNFNHLLVIHVYQITARHFGTFFIRAHVYVNFTTRTTRTRFTHLPKIIFFVSKNDLFLRQNFLPFSKRNFTWWNAIRFVSFKNTCVQSVFIYSQYVGQKLPTPSYRLGLKVFAKTPIPQHLKHGMVIMIYTYFL